MQRLSVLCALLVVCGGCASGSWHERTVAGVEIHTLREEYSNAHLIVSGQDAVLIDAGEQGSAAALEARIREVGVDPARLRAVIITHGHADHAGGAGHFRSKHGAVIVAGEGDRELLAGGRNDELCPTDARGRDDLERHQHARYEGIEAQVWVSAPVALEAVGGPKLVGEIVPIEGHTKGSLVVIMGESAFVGDMFRGAIVGGGATKHFYMCDLEDNRADIAKLLRDYPGVKMFYAGHFGPVTREEVEEMLEEWAE
jgi:hydroxyacylglutathione hydrolase